VHINAYKYSTERRNDCLYLFFYAVTADRKEPTPYLLTYSAQT